MLAKSAVSDIFTRRRDPSRSINTDDALFSLAIRSRMPHPLVFFPRDEV
jgi:hypothetical protein